MKFSAACCIHFTDVFHFFRLVLARLVVTYFSFALFFSVSNMCLAESEMVTQNFGLRESYVAHVKVATPTL